MYVLTSNHLKSLESDGVPRTTKNETMKQDLKPALEVGSETLPTFPRMYQDGEKFGGLSDKCSLSW